MRIEESLVRNPVKVAVGVLLVLLFGGISLVRMPMQLTPEVETPTITIDTRWPGASPQEVEKEIIAEQEEVLKGVEGATKISAECSDSRGRIMIEFLVGTNMDEAQLKVNSRLQQVREYPEDADLPVLSTANSSNRAIAWFILSTLRPSEEQIADFIQRHPHVVEDMKPVQSATNVGVALLRLRAIAERHSEVKELLPPDDLDVTKLRRFAEDEIESRFERVSGVSQSNVIGGLIDEMQVIVDPEKLAARQVTLNEVRQVLRSQNQDTSAGDFWEGKRRWVVRSLGQFRTPQQVEEQLLAVRDGAPVFVRDVAEVRLGFKKPDGLVRRYSESTIAVNCIRETNANVLEVMEGLREVNARLNRNVLNPRGLQLTQVYDETIYINSSVNLVQQNIFIGGALTMIVLMLFLHLGSRTLIAIPLLLSTALAAAYLSPWWFVVCLAFLITAGFWFARGALVVALAIPTSIIGTFLVLGLLGRSLNVISLAGLAFAVGMLVDNAVVVLENIYRRYDLGESALEAAVRGTEEVWGAVVTSTLTTIAVFLPVLFVQEQAGQLFRDIALAISSAVGLSLIVSVSLIPTASARLLRGSKRKSDRFDTAENRLNESSRNGKALHGINSFGKRFISTIVAANQWIQTTLLRRLATVGALVGFSIGVSWLLWPQVEYLPTGNRNLVIAFILPPPGYNLDQLMDLGQVVEDGLRPYWDADPGSPEAAQLDGPEVRDFFFVARGRSIFLGVRARDPLRAGELVDVVQRVTSRIPGTFAVAKQTSLFERGLTAGRTIDIEITGPDINKLVALGGQVFGQVKQIIPAAQARPVPSLDLSSPEVHVEPKLLQAAEMQMSSSDLGFAVNALVDGAYVSDYFLDNKKIDLTVIGETKYADQTHVLGAVPIATPLGQLVPLNALVDIHLSSGPEQINHRERVRAITIEVTPPPEIALDAAMQMVDGQIITPLREGGQLSGSYQINLAGTADKLRDTWQALRFNVLLALAITYLLMAALFESWFYPLIIIFCVPLGAVGGILGLTILNFFVLQPLDVLTMLGFVVLIGTVVNNPILIVHQSINLIQAGYPAREAVLESVRTRVRPIFMTTSTTVLGLLPLVLFPGAGSELYRGLGSVVIGGLIVSTAFTLLLVPTLFSLVFGFKQRLFGTTFGGTIVDEELPAPEEEALPLTTSL